MYTSLLEQRVGPRTADSGQTEVTCHSQPVPDTELSRQLMAKSTFLITIVLYTPELFFLSLSLFGDKASIEYDFLSITPQIYVLSPINL